MRMIDLTAEELAARLQERLHDVIRLQQRAHLKEGSALLNTCEREDVDGAVWEPLMRLTDTVNHMGGFLADMQALLAALMQWVHEQESGNG